MGLQVLIHIVRKSTLLKFGVDQKVLTEIQPLKTMSKKCMALCSERPFVNLGVLTDSYLVPYGLKPGNRPAIFGKDLYPIPIFIVSFFLFFFFSFFFLHFLLSPQFSQGQQALSPQLSRGQHALVLPL